MSDLSKIKEYVDGKITRIIDVDNKKINYETTRIDNPSIAVGNNIATINLRNAYGADSSEDHITRVSHVNIAVIGHTEADTPFAEFRFLLQARASSFVTSQYNQPAFNALMAARWYYSCPQYATNMFSMEVVCLSKNMEYISQLPCVHTIVLTSMGATTPSLVIDRMYINVGKLSPIFNDI